jgi:hypothetical protein
MIISGSRRILKEPFTPIPALQRLDGVFIRLVRKYNEKLRNVDILILSPIYGMITADAEIEYKEPIDGDCGSQF